MDVQDVFSCEVSNSNDRVTFTYRFGLRMSGEQYKVLTSEVTEYSVRQITIPFQESCVCEKSEGNTA